ncbi:SMP-30/gluconolactonase/LRE family protein [Streptomyces sp. MMS24-I2-30]|uniref:SMP-30/gluconolactonase/LRE family protein n=1 Tax=Streptomyces sp. MMS24-I2-30 TaxID=3351564 RepID=UPI003896C56B
MPRLPRLAGVAAAAVGLSVLTSAPALSGEPLMSAPRVVAHFDLAAGQTPENIALEPDGSADLTFASARQVANVTAQGRTRVLATLPAEARPDTPVVHDALVFGIVRAQDGTLYVTYATGTGRTGVWRIGRDGSAPRQIAQLPTDGLPNGLALDERRGVLYAADSVLGTVWRIPRDGGTPTAWARASALRPASVRRTDGFGANGVKVHRDAVWVSNSDRGTLLRIPVRSDGSAGATETRATGLGGIDDFAFPGPGTTVFAALSETNRVALVRPDGTHTVVLVQRDGLSDPTSVAVRGRTVYVPGAARSTRKDPNLLVAQLRRHFSR